MVNDGYNTSIFLEMLLYVLIMCNQHNVTFE
uniref:Uncharacterized protein n=1 Tax=Rhizophora mucronata TaxID=61149 RepID=A0A2P2K2T7_RHIMU